MDLFLYLVISAVYIMLIHFAVAIRNEFSIWFMVGLFILGVFMGAVLHSYEIGFVGAVIINLLFW